MFINCLLVLGAPFIFPPQDEVAARRKRSRAGAFVLRRAKRRVAVNAEFQLCKRGQRKNLLRQHPK